MNVLVVTSHRPWELTEPLETTDVSVTTLEIDASRSLVQRTIDTVRGLYREFRGDRPDIVVVDVYEVSGLLTLLFSRLARTNVVVRLVGDRTGGVLLDQIQSARASGDRRSELVYRLMYLLSSVVISNADGAIVVSTDLKRTLCSRGTFRPERVAVVPVPFRMETLSDGGNTVDTNRRQLVQEEQVAEPRTRLLTVTNLKYQSKYDGVRTILSEITPLLGTHEDLEYVIAGGGVFEDRLRRDVIERLPPSIRERVTVTGYVEDVTSLYRSADIFVYVSYLDGYPNAVLEAQGMGLPVVANEDFGMVDQIQDGETGLLVDPDESGALRNAVERLLESPDEGRRLGENARNRVDTENAVSVIGTQLVSALCRLRSAR
ncbi:glycosyltransferase family 4 protein [Natrarchaeobaculum aegyptiacum]|nr:glycosyltransferase family 4 protein [Natrarchaeobaculum aegyptiacum]